MTGLPNATPAPGSGSGLPAPAAPVAAPEAAPVVAPVATAKPGDVVTAAALPTSPPSPTTPANPTTPAAAPTVEPVTTEPVAEVKPREVFKSGNESFDQVANLLSERGVANYAAILQEAADGNVSLESKAELAETLGGPVADIVLKQLEGEVASQKAAGSAEATRLKNKAAEIFGYPADQADDTWAALQNFSKSTESGLSESDLAVLGEMLEKGGVQGDMAVNDLASRYERSQGFQKVPNLMSGDGQTQSGFEPLDKLNYQTAMREAQQKFGEGSREVDALRARRTASIQRGF
tara:strand:+ start:7834 stop:8712 length:879 start_codon:yes stop_codon:yes gene_type:complete